jgi:hypothetical protein
MHPNAIDYDDDGARIPNPCVNPITPVNPVPARSGDGSSPSPTSLVRNPEATIAALRVALDEQTRLRVALAIELDYTRDTNAQLTAANVSLRQRFGEAIDALRAVDDTFMGRADAHAVWQTASLVLSTLRRLDQ